VEIREYSEKVSKKGIKNRSAFVVGEIMDFWVSIGSISQTDCFIWKRHWSSYQGPIYFDKFSNLSAWPLSSFIFLTTEQQQIFFQKYLHITFFIFFSVLRWCLLLIFKCLSCENSKSRNSDSISFLSKYMLLKVD
jgi:hypothetical protein